MKAPSKIMYADLETTGVNEKRNAIIQMAFILEKDGVEVARFSALCAPSATDEVNDDALVVNKRTREEIYAFPPPVVTAEAMVQFLNKHIAPYDTQDKWAFCGHNSNFDKNFLFQFFQRYTKFSIHNYVHTYILDTYSMAQTLWLAGEFKGIENLKLPTLAKLYGFTHQAHDALSDTEVARDLFKIFWPKIGGVYE